MKKIIFLISVLFSIQALADVKILDSEIKFTSVGRPSFIKVKGSVPLVEVDLKIINNELSGSAKVDLNKLSSGIKLRDRHLKEDYLHVKNFPSALLTIEKQRVSFLGEKNKLKATLNFHGKEKVIDLNTALKREDKTISLSSNFEFLLTDFGVKLPSFQGITAANKVNLEVNAKFEL